MRCFLINLDRSRDRLAHMTAEFDRIGIIFERIAAIDALQRPDLSRIPSRTGAMPSRLANPEIACLLSHRACWSMLAAGDDPYGAIFEDDILFAAKAGALLADSSWIPADADIVKLETFFQKTKIGLRRSSAGHGFSASRLYEVHFGCAGYILSKQAAIALLGATEEVGVPADHVLFDPILQPRPDRVVYQLSPALCIQEQFLEQGTGRMPSLIQQDRDIRFVASDGGKKPRRSTLERVKREIGRLLRKLGEYRRLRYSAIVQFEHQGRRMRRPHTQGPKNRL